MDRRKGIIAIVLGVLCAFVLGACSVLGIDGAGRKAEKAADSGSVEVEQEEKAAYSTGGQLKYPLAALNNARTLYSRTTSSQTGNYSYAAGSTSGTSTGNTGYDTIVLRPGFVYLFEVYGAQGGKGWLNGANTGGTGGNGGYSKGYYEVSTNTTIYVYVGGQGGSASNLSAGGYNGGGSSQDNDRDHDDAGGGGGGASDIRVGGTALANRIIVAGGGGGGGCGSGNGGTGGGEKGTTSSSAVAGTQTSGNALGVGASCVTATTSGGGAGGGGGGGYYGGGTPTSGSYTQGGGGGSGYVGGVKWQTGTANGAAVSIASTAMMSNGTKSGAGQVKITEFSTITIQATPNLTGRVRGTETSIANTSVAYEYAAPNYGLAFYGNGSTPYIYYLNGSTYTNAAGRYVDNVRATVTANNTGSNIYNQTLYFTPRVYMNNQTLYFKMHSLKYNFDIYLPFKVTTVNNNWAKKTQTLVRNGLTLKVGSSSTSSVDLTGDPNSWGIYNPSGTGKQTMFVTMPIGINSSLTVNATDFYTDADAADGVYISAQNKNGNDADFDTTLNAVSDGLSFTTYNSITIKPKSTDNTGYMRLTLTLRNYEKKANYSGVSLPSGATLESSGHVKWAETTVDVVFRLDNTRPVPMSATVAGSKTDASVTVKSGSTAKIYVNQFAYDPDRNVNRIIGIKVPTNHFLPVKKDGTTIVDIAASSPYHDYISNDKLVPRNDTAQTGTYYSGEGNAASGFSSGWLSNNSADGKAYVSYSIRTDASNGLDYIEFTGIRATDSKWTTGAALGDFYVLVQIQDAGEEEDPGIWLPIAIRVTDGDSAAALTKPTMTFKANQSEIFTPWGMTYQIGTTQNTVGMGINKGTVPTSSELGWNTDVATGYPHRYLATDRDNFVYTGSALSQVMNRAQNDPLFIDHKDPQVINLQNNTAATNSDFSKFFKVELVPLYMLKSIFTGLSNYSTLVANGYINETSQSDVVWINGLKVTALKSTQNMFIEFDVKIVSSRVRKEYGATDPFTHSIISSLRCKVEGSSPTLLNDLGTTIVKDGGATIDTTSNTLTVNVKNGQTLQISPYDFVTDGDLPSEITRNNSNPDGDGFDEMQDAINAAYRVKVADSAAGALLTSGSIVSEGMRMDRLRFGSLGYIQNDRYASITCDPDNTSDTNASRPIDRIIITGKEKPTSQSVFASTSVNVYDSQGNNITVTINVRVINSAPQLSAAAIERDYFRLSASGTANATNDELLPDRTNLDNNENTNQFYDDPTAAANNDHNIQNVGAGKVYYNVREYTVRELVYDVDGTDRERGLISISESSFGVPYNYTRVLNQTTGQYEYIPLEDLYVKAEIANGSGNRSNERVLRVTGVSSTQGLTGGLFLRFVATDETTPAVLFLQFEVMNSDPVVNSEGLTESERNGENVYSWAFEESDRRTAGKSRFIVADDKLGAHLTDGNSSLYKVIASDPDSNQKVVPVATAANFTDKVPTVIDTTVAGNGNGVLAQDARPEGTAAVWLTYGGDDSPGEGYTVTNRVFLRYYQKTADGQFELATLPSNANWKTTLDYYWAVEVNSNLLSASATGVQLHITLTSSNRDVYTLKEQKNDNGDTVFVRNDDVKGGTEGGFGARTDARVRGNGTTVTYTDSTGSHDVVNSVTSSIKVNLDIIQTAQGLTNNFDINSEVGNVNDDGYSVYYAEAPAGEAASSGYKTEKTTFAYHPINVATTGYTAIPLSYFARLYENRKYPQEMLSTVNYDTSVAVETQDNFYLARSAITIFDNHGNSWTGGELNNNPYVNVEWAYPDEILQTQAGSQLKYLNLNKPVYDSTINQYGIVTSAAASVESTLYTEDTRGIKLTKKYQRSNDDVYISVQLCEWMAPDGAGYRKELTAEEQTWREESERIPTLSVPTTPGMYTVKRSGAPVSTVTVKLNIDNSYMTLNVARGETIRTNVGAVNSAIFLSNVGTSGDNESIPSTYTGNNVVYNVSDPDNVNIVGRTFNGSAAQKDLYRDKALFLANSISGTFAAEEIERINDQAKNGRYADAIKSYLGGAETVADGYNPNPNYENYFTLGNSLGDTGLLSIRPVRKTELNVDTLKAYKADVQELATAKGLGTLETIPSNTDPNYATVLDTYARVFDLRYDSNGFYYPFKVIAYDDYNGSGFVKSIPTAIEVKIYIDNTAPSVNEMVTTSTETISFNLSVTDDPIRSFDIATLLNDSDMLRNEVGTNYYFGQNELVAKYTAYKNAAKDANGKPTDNNIDDFRLLDLLTTDYIGSINVTRGGSSVAQESDKTAWESSSNPVSYWIEKNNSDAFLRINFHANRRVSSTTEFVMNFADNNNNIVAGGRPGTKSLKFIVSVTNNRPIEMSNETSPKEITMATGDYFTLLATSPDAFVYNENSGVGDSNSYRYWNNWEAKFRDGFTETYNNKFDIAANEKGVGEKGTNIGTGNLGSIVVFNDDTPWALRFDSSHVSISSPIISYERNVPENYFLYREDGVALAPLAYTFTADTPGVTTLKVRAFDESIGSYRDHEITVTVVSTLPYAKYGSYLTDHPLGEGISVLNNNNTGLNPYRYSYNMTVGDTRRFTLSDFAFDVDKGDDARMRLTPIQGSTYFFYNASSGDNDVMLNPSTAANNKQLISVSDRSENAFTVTAQDFYNVQDRPEAFGHTTVVEFRIADGSGASGYVDVHLWITVLPSDIKANGVNEFDVKSVLDYYTDSDAAPTSINLVSRENGANASKAVFIDNDLAANATMYTVEIYSMQRKTDTGYAAVTAEALAKMDADDRKAYLAYSSVSGAQTGDNVDYLWEFIDPKGIKFNETTGVLEFVPKKSTPVVSGELTQYELFVMISKPYYDSALENAKKECNNTFKFSVLNSAPTATPEVADNMNDDRTRFLTFNAYRGDEKEYTVFDPKAEDRKTLFEDYDVDDTLTVRSVDIKRIDGQAQIYKLYSERDDETGDYVQKRFTVNEQALEDGGTGRGAAVTIDRRNGKVKFTVNRRVTYDQYDNLPTYIVYTVTVMDTAGNTATTDVTVIVNNSLPGFAVPDTDEHKVLPENVTMEFDGLEYSMTIRLERDAAETVLNLSDFYTDKDFDTKSLSSDRAVFYGSDDPRFKYYDSVGSGEATHWGNSSFDNLFSVNATRDNAALVFRALSYERGQSVATRLIVSDGTGAEPVVMNITLIIDNTAPTFNTEVANELYIMGNNVPKSEYDDALDPVEYNLYDFIIDPNTNDLNPENDNRVQIGAQGGASSIVLSQRVREVTHDGEIVNENLVYVLPSATSFSISPRAGYYGYQEITINMRDGSIEGDDTKYAQFTLMIYVTRNPGDVPVTDLEIAYNKLIKVEPDMLFKDDSEIKQSTGFVIKTIEKLDSSSVVDITSVDNTSSDVKNSSELTASKTWFLRALNENGKTSARVEIAILGREDAETVWKEFNIINIVNRAPTFTSRFKGEGNVIFQSGEMVNNTATIDVYEFVEDFERDELTLMSIKSKKSIVVDATIDSVNQYILLNFKGRGTSPITVTLRDESQRDYTYTFVAENIDLPQLNFFMRIGANVQSNPLIYTIILCGILLFLIILIIIIAAAKKKKRMREEIEALLVSEMELEEQMLKLAASPSPTFYQSYGYLSPTQNVQNNPQFMLGEGSNAPGPNPNALGLNAGSGNKAPNAGTPPTIDDDEL